MWYIVLVAAVVSVAKAQVFGALGCPTVKPQASFDLQKYLGDWYEIYKFKANFENGQKCAHANYLLKDDGHIRVNNSGKTADGKMVQALGDLYMPDSTKPSSLKVKFASAAPYGNYVVIDTDYTNYTLIYSCTSILGISHFEFAWILGRQRTMDQALVDRLFAELKSYNVNVGHFMKEDQTGC
ncbi:apolipoprotein D and lipocalin family protein [Mytilus galloprovincialis]|uniref:Apolipoprotein D n=1 Tax=Mytilus galloprovincialis TaxID=29158 RepID=A0A8B6G894_MYTGA|nr:apolipoprotein D and lipocalin family protein [Mytilus galloprovincialis]